MNLAELPNRRVEAWKYTDLRAALSDAALPGEKARPADAWGRLEGVIDRLALGQDNHAITKVRAGEAEILVERLDMARLSASVREIQILPGGSLTRVVIQPSSDGVVLSAAHVALSEGATFRQFVLAEGAKLARVETHVSVEGEGAHVELNGAYLCGAGRHADLTSVIEHKVGGAETRQKVHGVVTKGGRGVFQGKIVVDRGAQKTDARQHHHGLLLQEGAEVFAKPELMIHADDVQCAHGNAIGGLDESALFYMRARGVPEAEARALLISAFVSEPISETIPEEVAQELLGRIAHWLDEARP